MTPQHVTAETIRSEHEKKRIPTGPLVLKHECKVLASPQTCMSALDSCHDRIIALEAVHISDYGRLVARRPCKPSFLASIESNDVTLCKVDLSFMLKIGT